MGTEQRNIRALSWPSQTTGIVGNLFITFRQEEVLLQKNKKVVTDRQFIRLKSETRGSQWSEVRDPVIHGVHRDQRPGDTVRLIRDQRHGDTR